MRSFLLVGIALLTGCVESPPSEEAFVGVRGQVADSELCAEHGVLQSVCPQCNPALAPVFQARGDWCDEHGFPESFCPTCHPDRQGRPVERDLSADGDPADGTIVRFRTRDAARLAGIETSEATATEWTDGVQAVARLTWDATRVSQVSARTDGLVVRIEADVGTPVQAGEPLARLQSAHVSADRSRERAARHAVTVAETELARKQSLLEAGVSAERQVLMAEQAVQTAQAELAALQAELDLVGSGSQSSYTLTAPTSGVVTVRGASVGQWVDARETLFEIVDASRLWAELDVPEAELGQIQVGQPVQLEMDAMPGRLFEGTLSYLAPAVNPQTRTAQARVLLDNPDGALRANQYGTAHVTTDAQAQVLTVPSAAVQRAGDVHLVFVRMQEDRFIARRVRVLGRQDGLVRIVGAVQAGDPVATTGSFLLKTETLKDSIGAGCCDVE